MKFSVYMSETYIAICERTCELYVTNISLKHSLDSEVLDSRRLAVNSKNNDIS